jgi:hypothetical protein
MKDEAGCRYADIGLFLPTRIDARLFSNGLARTTGGQTTLYHEGRGKAMVD